MLTNGGSEAIALVAGTLGGTVAAEPEFSLHPRVRAGTAVAEQPAQPHRACWPRPTSGVDVWDEAFYPLATGEWTQGDEDTVVVGSLTKLFACPGLRIGYVLADDATRLSPPDSRPGR